MSKNNRNYRITIQVGETEAEVIEYPLTMEFNITRAISSTTNKAIIKVYNLNRELREKIFKNNLQNIFNITAETLDENIRLDIASRQISIEIGYGNNLSNVFLGRVFEAYSYRNNADIITEIIASTATLERNTTFSNFTSAKNVTFRTNIEKLSANMGLKIGHIEEEIGNRVHKRATVFNGKSFKLLIDQYKDEKTDVYIDNDQLYVLGINSILEGREIFVNSDSGLLNIPRQRGTILELETLLEPTVSLARFCSIETSQETNKLNNAFNGRYKIIGLTHSGIASGAKGGDYKTKLQLTNFKTVRLR